MKRLLVIVVALVAACAPAEQARVPSPDDVRQTEVRVFDVWRDGGVDDYWQHGGVCDRRSKVVLRADAWRCRLGGDGAVGDHLDGAVAEPCFAHPTEPRAACPVGSTLLELPAPLPAQPPVGETPPWMLELWSGDRCTPVTGPPFDGSQVGNGVRPPDDLVPITMTCAGSRFVGQLVRGGIDTTRQPWTVEVLDDKHPATTAPIAVAYR